MMKQLSKDTEITQDSFIVWKEKVKTKYENFTKKAEEEKNVKVPEYTLAKQLYNDYDTLK